MTELQQLRTGLRVAHSALEKALFCDDAEEMKVLAIQAANRVLEAAKPRTVAIERDRCPNPGCGRLITERDPIFRGYCSTICRESNLSRVQATVHAKFAEARS